MPDTLIYDRTESDAQRKGLGTSKGKWNIADLERIEEWCDYLADLLTDAGYTTVYVPFSGTPWAIDDIPTIAEFIRMRTNVYNIALIQTSPTVVNPFSPVSADNIYPITYLFPNSLEYNLYLSNAIIVAIIYEYELERKCGTFICGAEGRLI